MIEISVIVPVYNTPSEYLRECFDSLTVQILPECEFIIVLDGSPDAAISICEEYAGKDSRFKIFNQPHSGVSAARNFGIDHAQGKYIAFVDGDDFLLGAKALENVKNALDSQPDILLLNWVDSSNISPKDPFKESISILSITQKEQCVSDFIFSRKNGLSGAPWAKIYRREYIESHHIRFNTNFSIGEDRVFNYDAFSYNCVVAYLDYSFYHYRIFPQSLSQKRSSFSPTNLFPYIHELKRLSQNVYPVLIAKETFSVLYKSWIYYYNTTDYSKSYVKRCLGFFQLALSKEVRLLIRLDKASIAKILFDCLKHRLNVS